jgi:hypothetical protein
MDATARANALGILLLTPIFRPWLQGHYNVPMGLIDANAPGAGKTLKYEATIEGVVLGRTGAKMLWNPEDRAEFHKAFVASLRTAPPTLCFDNATGAGTCDDVAQYLTTQRFNGRVLGKSEMANLDRSTLLYMTANRKGLGLELARRAFVVKLVTTPALRRRKPKDFRHADLKGYVAEHRAELLHALLVLARNWYAAGQPRLADLAAEHPDEDVRTAAAAVPGLPSFERWRDVIGATLVLAGVPGFLGNVEKVLEDAAADDEGAEWEAWLRAVHGKFGAESWAVSALVGNGFNLAEECPAWGPVRKKAGDGWSALHARELGRAVRGQLGAPYGAFRLEDAGKDRKETRRYRVTVDPAELKRERA